MHFMYILRLHDFLRICVKQAVLKIVSGIAFFLPPVLSILPLHPISGE